MNGGAMWKLVKSVWWSMLADRRAFEGVVIALGGESYVEDEGEWGRCADELLLLKGTIIELHLLLVSSTLPEALEGTSRVPRNSSHV
jgi:hypothetical protein